MPTLRGLFTVKPTQDQVRESVAAYLDKLPDDKAAKMIARIMGAHGLTDTNVRRMLEAVKGERVIEISFGNGDTAVISNRTPVQKAGPGW